MKKRIVCFFGVLLLIAMLCGCGEEPKGSYISINKDGTITQKIVESFEEENYDIEELRSKTQNELDTYAAGSKLTELVEEDGKVTLIMDFDSLASFNAFNQTNLFSGTVKEALEASDGTYFADVKLVDAKKEKEVPIEDITGNGELSVVIFEEDTTYQVSGNLRYMSDNLELVSKKSVRLKEGQQGPGYLIY